MSMKQEFYLTLPSNVKSRGEEKNLICNYKTTLKNRINFPANEEWRVGIAEIIYTKSWFNVTKDSRIKFMNEFGEYVGENEIILATNVRGTVKAEGDSNVIESGYYNNVSDLIDLINYKMSIVPLGEFTPQFTYLKHRNQVILGCGQMDDENKTHYIPILSEEINNILGLIDSKGLSLYNKIIFNAGKSLLNEHQRKDIIALYGDQLAEVEFSFARGHFISYRRTDIKGGVSSIYIYSNLVQYSYVGDAYAQLLRTIPVKETEKWGDVVHHVFDKPHLIPLQSRNFDTIEIDIKDDAGAHIPFEIGRVTIKLVFKKDDL